MDLLERLVRAHARRITRNGITVLTANAEPLLVDAFKELGWQDPHEDTAEKTPSNERATLEAPERAVLPRPEGHEA